jgi:hypothetical protein
MPSPVGEAVCDQTICRCADDGERDEELHRGEERASPRGAGGVVRKSKIGGRLFGRRTVKALSLGHSLAAAQGRGVAQLAEIADRRSNVEDAGLADVGVVAEANFVDVQAVAICGAPWQ